MATEIEITVYNDRPKQFWADMGPFFARRDIRREMPYLVDDEGDVWFVARSDRKVVGFAAVKIDTKKVGHLHGLYVVPELRGNGVADRIIAFRLAHLRGIGIKTARTTANAASAPQLSKHGFEAVSAKGKYQVMEVAL